MHVRHWVKKCWCFWL